MFSAITERLGALAQVVPLELFTFMGSFIEELIAPIPSPFVPMMSGSIALAQGKTFMYLLVLSLIGAAGKTMGAWLVYFISDKAEDIVVGKLGRFIGVTQTEVEQLGKRFSGTNRDWFLLTFLRALPIMPSVLVSVGSGVIKIRLWLYITSTFVGTIIRDFFYLYVGFTGVETLQNLIHGFESTESIIEAVVAVLIVLFIAWIYWKRKVKKQA